MAKKLDIILNTYVTIFMKILVQIIISLVAKFKGYSMNRA